MKAYEIRGAFGLKNLVPVDRPEVEPGPGQVQIRVKAASLNFRDLMTVKGVYNPRQPLPLIPLSDGAGEVAKVGDGVTRVKVGDRVTPIFNQGWISGGPTLANRTTTLGGPLEGMLAEKAVVDAEGLVKIPEYLSYLEAATLPCAAVTAWNALVTEGRVVPGQVVLVQGTGGVSLFALQLARLMGARVIVTSGSDAKLERARELGASDLINYKTTPEWDRRVREITSNQGADHIIEVGGAGTLGRSLGAVRIGGTISVIGILSGRTTELDLAPVLMKKVRLQGIFVGSRESFEEMNRALEASRLKPVIDSVHPFEDAPAAFEKMERGDHFGKIVIEI